MPRVRAAVRPPADAAPEAPSMSTKRPPIRRAASAMPALPPTPPRTTHKRKRRSRSRVTDSSSEDEDDHAVPEPESDREDAPRSKDGAVAVGHKKRKTMTLDAIAEELSEARAEEQFWMGGQSDGASSSTAVAGSSSSTAKGEVKHKVLKNRASSRARSRTRSPSSSPPPAPHLLRRNRTGLFSPPPSRRAPTIVPRPATPPPSTRPRKIKDKETGLPERDSPNNPFLVDSSPGSVPASGDDLSSPEPRTPQKHVEKPTITVVFRGVRAAMLNPHYVPDEVREEHEARARLPVRHPDFEALDACPPTLLFPEARKHDLAARRRAQSVTLPEPTSPTPTGSKRSRASSTSSEETTAKGKRVPAAEGAAAEEDVDAMSAALAANIARRMRKGVLADGEAPRTRPSSRGEPSEPPAKDRSDPVKRALGPQRRA